MRLTTLHLTIVFSSLTTSTRPRDTYNLLVDPTLPAPATPPNKPEFPFHDEHSPLCPSNTQPAPPQCGWHALGVGIATIAVAAIVWPLCKYLAGNAEDGRLIHRAGRSLPVSGPAPEQALPGGDPPQPHDDFTKTRSLHKRPTAVASGDIPSPPIPPIHRATNSPSSSEKPEELDGPAADPLVTPRVHLLQNFVVVGRRILRTWNWPLVRQSHTVVCLTLRPRGPYSLLRSLHRGARDFGESRLELEQCLFFFVGVDTPGHEDAENDIKFLQQVLQSPARGPPPQYRFIYGPSATRAKICEMMRALVGGARAMVAPQIFMLFTGTGDECNRMCLSNGETLSESDLTDRLPSNYQTNELTLSMLFDICRIAVFRLAVGFQRAEMAWSCSMGQLAYAIRLSKQEDKLFPRSIFLLAIFLAAHHTNLHSQDSHFFEAAFIHHINQLSEFIRFAYDKGHQDQCVHCAPNKPCDPPVAQTPDLQYAGRAVTNLGMLIATYFPQHAHEVFDEVGRSMFKGEFPERLCPLFDPDAVQPVASSTGDGSYLDPRKVSRAKGGLATVENAVT